MMVYLIFWDPMGRIAQSNVFGTIHVVPLQITHVYILKISKYILFYLIHQNKQLAYHNLLKLGMPFFIIIMEIT